MTILFFLLGRVAAATWGQLAVPAAVLGIVWVFAYLRSRSLNALQIGDETATELGVDVNRFRSRLLIACALLTGAVVAVSGGIGFVGLVIPHISRIAVGGDHRRMLPVAVLGVAPYLVFGLVAGALADLVGAQGAYLLLAVPVAAGTVLLLASPVRRLRTIDP